jgi:hypothetical protein
MDLALLDGMTTVSWSQSDRVVGLGCGTARTEAWRRTKGGQTSA